MILNAVPVNAALTTGFLTGDVNGTTLVWADQAEPSGTWSKIEV